MTDVSTLLSTHTVSESVMSQKKKDKEKKKKIRISV